MRFILRRLLVAAVIIAAMSAFAPPVWAQAGATTASIAGTVIDSTGAVLPGADVTVKDMGTGTTYTAVTGSRGEFNVPALPIGTYSVTVSLMGFKTAVVSGVPVSA